MFGKEYCRGRRAPRSHWWSSVKESLLKILLWGMLLQPWNPFQNTQKHERHGKIDCLRLTSWSTKAECCHSPSDYNDLSGHEDVFERCAAALLPPNPKPRLNYDTE